MKYIIASCVLLIGFSSPSYGQGTGPMGGGGGMNQVIQGANSITNLVNPYYWNIPLETSNAVMNGSLTISNDVNVVLSTGTHTNSWGGAGTNIFQFVSAAQSASGNPAMIQFLKAGSVRGELGYGDTGLQGFIYRRSSTSPTFEIGNSIARITGTGGNNTLLSVSDSDAGVTISGGGSGANLTVNRNSTLLGGLRLGSVFTGTNYIMSSTDNIVMFNATSVGTTVSATLPPSSTTVTNGIMFVIKDFQRVASATNIIVYAGAGTTINGVNSATINSDGGALSISMGGTNYFTY